MKPLVNYFSLFLTHSLQVRFGSTTSNSEVLKIHLGRTDRFHAGIHNLIKELALPCINVPRGIECYNTNPFLI